MSAPPPSAPAEPHRHHAAWIEWLAVAGAASVAALVRAMPLGLARGCARPCGRLIYVFGGTRWAGVGRNLRIAFGPGLDAGRERALARAYWVHLCQAVVEALHLAKWTPESFPKYVDLSELAKLEPYLSPGRGLIIVSGHLGSWEVGPYALALLGRPVHLLHNPGTVAPLFEYLKRQRERSGMKVLAKDVHPWGLKKLLDRGGWLCIALDINAGRRGTFFPFFGVLASTYLSAAALQQASGCPIAVLSTARQADGRHRLHVWRIIERVRAADQEKEQERVTREINAALEEAIRAYPEQWLWHNRRWRSRPPGETPGPDGLPPRV